MRAARTLAERGQAAQPERNAKNLRLPAISAASRTACPSNRRRAGQCFVVIASVPAARRIAAREEYQARFGWAICSAPQVITRFLLASHRRCEMFIAQSYSYWLRRRSEI